MYLGVPAKWSWATEGRKPGVLRAAHVQSDTFSLYFDSIAI